MRDARVRRVNPIGRSSRNTGLLLLATAYSVLAIAWIFANPPFAAPDEWAHFIRATSIGYGQLIGTEIPARERVLGNQPGVPPSAQRAQERWAHQNTRRVNIPAGHTPDWFGCSLDPTVPATCLLGSHPASPAETWAIPTGNYQPFPYLLPALVARIGASPEWLDRGMRTAKAVLALGLLIAALAVLWVPGESALTTIGLIVAVTPMTLFLSSSLNPSGLEITAAIAFFACLLHLARYRLATPVVWVTLGFSGVVVVLSRGEAPVWIVLDLGVFLMLVGVRSGFAMLRQGGRYSVGAWGLIGLGIVANRVWEHLYGPHFIFDPTPLPLAVRAGWFELPEVLREQVGVFDYLEFRMSPLAYVAWFSMTAALFAIALLVGNKRERISLCIVALAAAALPVSLIAAIMRHTGYGLQGRYVMAFLVVVPLLAGEVVFRHRDLLSGLAARRVAWPFACVAALVQLDALYANARRFAVGTVGPDWFLPAAVWRPPGGWWLWIFAAVAGSALLAFAVPADSAVSRRASRRSTNPLGQRTDPDG